MKRKLTVLTLVVTLIAPVSWPFAERLRAGFQVTFIDPPGDTFGNAVAVDPSDPNVVYIPIGGTFWTTQDIYRVDLTVPSSPVFELVAAGAFDVSSFPGFVDGDDVLDSKFGSIWGLTVLPGGELILVDNNAQLGPPIIPGDTVFIARDLNADGDFLDVVGGEPEVTELIDLTAALPPGTIPPGAGPAGFTGVQAKIAPVGSTHAGDVFVIDSDKDGAGEVIRIDDPTGTPSANVFFAGLDIGSGLAWDGDVLFASELDDSFAFGRLWRLEDLNADGDAQDGGEATLVSSLLPGAFDIALTNDGALNLTTLGEELFELSPVAAAAPPGRFVTGLGGLMSLGGVVPDGTANPFAPNAGPGGQRLYTSGNDFAGTSSLIILEPAPASPVTPAQPFFSETSMAPPTTALTWGAALAVRGGASTEIWATLGGPFNTDQEIWRVDITDPDYPAHTRLAAGALDVSQYDGVSPNFVSGEDLLDSLFATVGGLAVLPGGQLIIVDNNARSFATPNPIPGDTVYLAEDLNADGDFLDVVDVGGTPTPEVTELIDLAAALPGKIPAGTGFAGFSGAQVEIGPDGAVYVITADGFNGGEVIRIADPIGTPAAGIFFEDAADGIDFGAGLAWIGTTLHTGDLDESFGFARLRSHTDGNADDDATDVGESAVITSALPGKFDLAAGPASTLWCASGFGPASVTELSTATGVVVRTVVDSANALGDAVFTTTAGPPFIPAVMSPATLVTQSTDFAGTTFLHLLSPDPTVPVGLSGFMVR